MGGGARHDASVGQGRLGSTAGHPLCRPFANLVPVRGLHVIPHGFPGEMQAQTALKLDCQLTCPHCGQCSTITMPTDACQFFLDCPACAALVSPKAGDCCVFCSYGSVP